MQAHLELTPTPDKLSPEAFGIYATNLQLSLLRAQKLPGAKERIGEKLTQGIVGENNPRGTSFSLEEKGTKGDEREQMVLMRKEGDTTQVAYLGYDLSSLAES